MGFGSIRWCVWSVRPSSPWRLPHLKCLLCYVMLWAVHPSLFHPVARASTRLQVSACLENDFVCSMDCGLINWVTPQGHLMSRFNLRSSDPDFQCHFHRGRVVAYHPNVLMDSTDLKCQVLFSIEWMRLRRRCKASPSPLVSQFVDGLVRKSFSDMPPASTLTSNSMQYGDH